MSDIPVWVDWFGQLSTKIFKAKEDGLIGLVEDLAKIKPAMPKFIDGKIKPNYRGKSIDPFSFLYSLAQTLDEKNNKVAAKESVSLLFGIDDKDIFSGSAPSKPFPSLKAPGRPWFHDGKEFNPDVLWRLFRQVHKRRKIKAKDFADALKINYVKTGKLTQCFFYIRPKDFFPIIEATMPIIQEKLRGHKYFELCSLKKLKNQIENGEQGWIDYKCLLSEFKSVSNGKPFYEIYEECINAEE